MDTKIKHWLLLLEIIKQELIWSPYDNTVYDRVCELMKEMKEAQEEIEATDHG